MSLLIISPFESARSQQATIQTIISNGPPANRFNLVLLSEGYTSTQLQGFQTDATIMVEALLNHPPFQQYRASFNAFAISVSSAESGADHPASKVTVNTYFNSSYDLSDTRITIPLDSRGQGKIDSLVKTLFPAADLAVVIVNDPVPGGSDGGQKTAIVSRGLSITYMSDILAHEAGHVIAGLGDEYETAFAGYPDTEEPNTTRETRREALKWRHWISDSTPVPTPPLFQYRDAVGLFEGAHYHSTTWYRPKLNCAMRDNFSAFCEVCTEALVISLYQQVRPVDAWEPSSNQVQVTTPDVRVFRITPLQNSSNSVTVQWFTNEVAVAGAHSPSFEISPLLLRTGTNRIEALVYDGTPLVRLDPSNLLRQQVSWTVDVHVPQLRLDAPTWLGQGRFVFRISGDAPNGFVLQSSGDLSTWVPLATNSLSKGAAYFTNVVGVTGSGGYYRALIVP